MGGLTRSRPGSQRSVRSTATSRYMQAAEAYAARGRAQATNNGRKTPDSWGRRRAPDVKYATTSRVRTSSASPAPHQRDARGAFSGQVLGVSPSMRRERTFGGGDSGRATPVAAKLPSSTQSTPSRRPNPRVAKVEEPEEPEEGEDALKKMEQILMSLKSRVEDRLAAEGQELPKDIFEDFTSQWVTEATSALANTPTANRSRNPSGGQRQVRTTPLLRKDQHRGEAQTRIPVPTFYGRSQPATPAGSLIAERD